MAKLAPCHAAALAQRAKGFRGEEREARRRAFRGKRQRDLGTRTNRDDDGRRFGREGLQMPERGARVVDHRGDGGRGMFAVAFTAAAEVERVAKVSACREFAAEFDEHAVRSRAVAGPAVEEEDFCFRRERRRVAESVERAERAG